MKDDAISPKHYKQHTAGIECIEVARWYNFNIGNVFKYIWRAGLKEEQGKTPKEKQIEDLKKALYYLTDEIQRLEDEE